MEHKIYTGRTTGLIKCGRFDQETEKVRLEVFTSTGGCQQLWQIYIQKNVFFRKLWCGLCFMVVLGAFELYFSR